VLVLAQVAQVQEQDLARVAQVQEQDLARVAQDLARVGQGQARDLVRVGQGQARDLARVDRRGARVPDPVVAEPIIRQEKNGSFQWSPRKLVQDAQHPSNPSFAARRSPAPRQVAQLLIAAAAVLPR
jgi:hypothetical protein